jgi:serine/threonine-protein kinase
MQPGALLQGRYHLTETLGQGGMGEVFEATDAETGRVVAIKIVRRASEEPTLMARMQREAEAAMRVRSAFVPELYDVAVTDEGELFLVMERLHGETLAQRLLTRGRLTWPEVQRIGDDVLRGLSDAHEAGVIHRDLKPANIFLARERTRILDFGVCKLERHAGDPITTAGESVGTVAYMAPEQIRGASSVDGRVDLYSFGVVVFEALSGALPYEPGGHLALVANKIERAAKRLSDVDHEPVPEGLEALIARCLQRRPGDRHASALALVADWRALAEGGPGVARLSRPARQSRTLPLAALVKAARGSRAPLWLTAAAFLASSVVLALTMRARSLPRAPRAASELGADAPDAGDARRQPR